MFTFSASSVTPNFQNPATDGALKVVGGTNPDNFVGRKSKIRLIRQNVWWDATKAFTN